MATRKPLDERKLTTSRTRPEDDANITILTPAPSAAKKDKPAAKTKTKKK